LDLRAVRPQLQEEKVKAKPSSIQEVPVVKARKALNPRVKAKGKENMERTLRVLPIGRAMQRASSFRWANAPMVIDAAFPTQKLQTRRQGKGQANQQRRLLSLRNPRRRITSAHMFRNGMLRRSLLLQRVQ
jgi:hypothetical protein